MSRTLVTSGDRGDLAAKWCNGPQALQPLIHLESGPVWYGGQHGAQLAYSCPEGEVTWGPPPTQTPVPSLQELDAQLLPQSESPVFSRPCCSILLEVPLAIALCPHYCCMGGLWRSPPGTQWPLLYPFDFNHKKQIPPTQSLGSPFSTNMSQSA